LYRQLAKLPTVSGELATVRTYRDEISAQTDRVHLESEGIAAYVIGSANLTPAFAAMAGGVRLQVAEDDLQHARAILGAIAPEESAGDDEEAGVVRCPRCELAYCSFERPRIRNSAGAKLAFILLPLTMLFGKKRWRCEKCSHVWDDPKEGPAEITRMKPGDPRPVFRLRRRHGGMGLFLGFGAGMLGGLLAQGSAFGALLFIAFPLLGVFIGRGIRSDVCSVPECRAPLPPNAEECPRCKGGIAGKVSSAEEHFVAAADFRRELAEFRANDARAKKERRGKRLTG
jgi:hypothetical protein